MGLLSCAVHYLFYDGQSNEYVVTSKYFEVKSGLRILVGESEVISSGSLDAIAAEVAHEATFHQTTNHFNYDSPQTPDLEALADKIKAALASPEDDKSQLTLFKT